jgi:anti-sigma regulatory factor (Ser/Thr protein kinase)
MSPSGPTSIPEGDIPPEQPKNVVQWSIDSAEGTSALRSESKMTRAALRAVRYRAEITSRGATPIMRSEIYDIAIQSGFADRADDVAIAFTELVANAQQHGDPPIIVEAWWDGRLVIEVTNYGTGLDRDGAWKSRRPEPDEVRGRGLWIVRQLVDLVDVRTGTERTTVHVELSPEPHIGA